MIRTIKIIAVFVPLLLLIGILFKSNHWPGANVLLISGSGAGILLITLIARSLLFKVKTNFEKFNSLFTVAVITIGLLTFIFKIMHWPWANTLVWIADIGLLLAGISYLLDGLMEKDPVKWSLKFISMLFIFLLLLVIFLSQ